MICSLPYAPLMYLYSARHDRGAYRMARLATAGTARNEMRIVGVK